MPKVWFKLISGDDYTHDFVSTNDDCDIAEFRRAVKDACMFHLAHTDANRLKVYPPETTVPVPVGTENCDPEQTVVNYLIEGKGTFIVVAPSKLKQEQQIYGKCVFSSVLAPLGPIMLQ